MSPFAVPSPCASSSHVLYRAPPPCAVALSFLQICLTYAIINPFILVVGIPYFFASYVTYKHQMLYVYEPNYETGGVLFPKIFRRFIFAIIIAQVGLAAWTCEVNGGQIRGSSVHRFPSVKPLHLWG